MTGQNLATIRLRSGRERSLLRRHPWVFSGAVEGVEGAPAAGDTVAVRAADGTDLGRGAWSPESQIRVRMWTFPGGPEAEAEVGPELLRRRIERAVRTRLPLSRDGGSEETTARRLVHAESDGLPGLVVDRYGRFLVCQLLSAGAERWREEIVAALEEVLSPEGIWERSDTDARAKEGLPERAGLLAGSAPPELIEVHEAGALHLVDVRRGHKTGFYLDQRENRRLVAEAAAAVFGAEDGREDRVEVLNAFSYTGAFGHALLAAAVRSGAGPERFRVTHLDGSAEALELVRRTAEANGFPTACTETVEGNAFSELRGLRAADRRFDLVILDPPKFADSKRRLDAAARGYKDVNLLACQLLAPGGLLATFSCSGVLEPALFGKIVADAALDAGRDARILRHLAQPDDHPVALGFPEGRYLKGLLCRVW